MKVIKTVLISAAFLALSCNSSKKNEKKESVTSVTESPKFSLQTVLESNVSKSKLTAEAITSADSLPRNIKKGKTKWDYVNYQDWTSGFWPGVLWYAYEASGDEAVKKQAERFTEALENIAYEKADNHDIGFMMYCSYGNGYRLTGNEQYKKILLASADTLATLYNPNVGSILSWPVEVHRFRHNTIIDNMINLELLFWAAKNGGDKKLYDIAKSHAEITMKYIVREDNAVYHVASFNETTGEFLKGQTHQGYADDSMWARGQTWGIYGFSVAYRETGEIKFLETAKRLADHYINRLPEDGIPYWDFDAPNIPNEPKDASAAGVASCGMLELASLVKDENLKAKYTNEAKRYINILSSDKYLSGDRNQALLLHSTGHFPNGSEIDMPIVYADYYYMEALLRLKKLEGVK